MDCFAPLAMTRADSVASDSIVKLPKIRLRIPAARMRPGFARIASSEIKRAQGMPGAGRTHGLQQKTQAAGTTGTPNIPAFPAQWF